MSVSLWSADLMDVGSALDRLAGVADAFPVDVYLIVAETGADLMTTSPFFRFGFGSEMNSVFLLGAESGRVNTEGWATHSQGEIIRR